MQERKGLAKKAPSESVQLEEAFWAAFFAEFHFLPPRLHKARDRDNLNKLVAALGSPAEVLRLIPLFFAAHRARDPQIRRRPCMNIQDFFYSVEHLLFMERQGGQADLHPRTAENIHEVTKAMGRKR